MGSISEWVHNCYEIIRDAGIDSYDIVRREAQIFGKGSVTIDTYAN